MQKTQRKNERRKVETSARAQSQRPDHEMISYQGHLIPVLGTVGGTPEESRQTAENIERFFASQKRK